jgi:hypothetical protein
MTGARFVLAERPFYPSPKAESLVKMIMAIRTAAARVATKTTVAPGGDAK